MKRLMGPLAAGFLLFLAPPAALSQPSTDVVDVKAKTQAVFPVVIADGKIALGRARIVPLGSLQARDGEIAVQIDSPGLTPYAKVHIVEKTAVPIDFVATGLIGSIKIDEIIICGRLDQPIETSIAAGSLRISLNRFEVGKGAEACQ